MVTMSQRQRYMHIILVTDSNSTKQTCSKETYGTGTNQSELLSVTDSISPSDTAKGYMGGPKRYWYCHVLIHGSREHALTQEEGLCRVIKVRLLRRDGHPQLSGCLLYPMTLTSVLVSDAQKNRLCEDSTKRCGHQPRRASRRRKLEGARSRCSSADSLCLNALLLYFRALAWRPRGTQPCWYRFWTFGLHEP